MRIVLEWLGIVEPQRGRREPVALPAWAPVFVPVLGAVAAGLTFAAALLLVKLFF